jgi:hypothetical protein
MYHPETMRRLVNDRHETYRDEARRERIARELRAASHEAPRERFNVRDLRWLLLRPTGA